jgi:hypothetical protein
MFFDTSTLTMLLYLSSSSLEENELLRKKWSYITLGNWYEPVGEDAQPTLFYTCMGYMLHER